MSGQHLLHEGLDPEHIQQLNTLLRRMIEQVRDAPADVVIGAPAATGTPAAGR
jgi:hypothetical protein